jgi:hypothetical protein
VIGEQRAVGAFLRCEPLVRGALEVEVRECEPTTDPRSGKPVAVPPLVILWVEDRPHAVRVRSLVAVNRLPLNTRVLARLEAELLAAGVAVERVYEGGLWRLFQRPPQPRLAL